MRYMDYDKFKKEYEAFEEWNKDKWFDSIDKETNKASDDWEFPNLNMYNQASLTDAREWLRKRNSTIREKIDRFQNERVLPVDNDGNILHPFGQKDMVNSPAHYTRGTQEAIDIIEEAIQDAPDVKAGMLQAQTLKYLLRLWLKGNAPQDADKARWYLERLIAHLKSTAFEE
jgi:predicted metal-dependent hydrolase